MSIETRHRIKRSESWYNPSVHQATGMIIAQTATAPNEAWRLLVAEAESVGSSVDSVAADVIAGTVMFF